MLSTVLPALLIARLSSELPAFPDPPIGEQLAKARVLKHAVLAGGCFWCTEAVFEQVEGVVEVVAGYSGGTRESADYRTVSTGLTGHAEAIRISYDASVITYGQLLRIFFEVAHDPTQLNRQGPDVGPQYRSAIFYQDQEQKRIAEAYIARLEEARVFSGKIVTRLEAFQGFYPAEEYHQDFVVRNPDHPYVVARALPKVEKLRKACPRFVRSR